jgi:hypothetical protein
MPEAIVALGRTKRIVGRLRFESDARRQHSQFEYADEWLAAPDRFALWPGLPLREGGHYSTGKENKRSAVSECFADAAPDSWGARIDNQGDGHLCRTTVLSMRVGTDGGCHQSSTFFPRHRTTGFWRPGLFRVVRSTPPLISRSKRVSFFDVKRSVATQQASRMARAIVDGWRRALCQQGTSSSELKVYASAFEHEEMDKALND